MHSSDQTVGRPRDTARPAPVFTPQTANQALVLVRRIVQDVVSLYAELMDLRSRREDMAQTHPDRPAPESLTRQIEERVRRLRALQEELEAVGCELKDWSLGLVDFPARRGGRPVYLCWKLGEPQVRYWHEMHAGFAGRRPIDAEFDIED